LAQVDHDDGSYVLVGAHTLGVLRLLLAFLLDNGLWPQGLTFLTDGQKTLQGAILRAFSWWGHAGMCSSSWTGITWTRSAKRNSLGR
jgi:hypothetical protein